MTVGRPADVFHTNDAHGVPATLTQNHLLEVMSTDLKGEPEDVLHRNSILTGDPEDVLHRNSNDGSPVSVRHVHSLASVVFGSPGKLTHGHSVGPVVYSDAEGWPENLWHAHGPSSSITVANSIGSPDDIIHGHVVEVMPTVLPELEMTLAGKAQDAIASFSLEAIVGARLVAKAQDAIAGFSMHTPSSLILAAQSGDASASFTGFRYNNICWDEKEGSGVTMEEHRQETTPDWKKC